MFARRAFMLGGGALAVGLAGLGYRAVDRGLWGIGEGAAFEPWATWLGSDADGAMRPLRAAILAANPHDTQPWAFAVRADAIDVYADRSRNLGAFDPFRREMHLGLGAAIENLVLAARAFGFAAMVAPTEGSLAPLPDDRLFRAAQVRLSPAQSRQDDLFAAIPDRHTNRGPYLSDRPVGQMQIKRFVELVSSDDVRVVFILDEAARRDVSALIVEATRRIVDDLEMSADSARWFRGGRREIVTHRDGVTLDTAGLSRGMEALAKLLPDTSPQTSDAYWLGITRDVQAPSAPAFGLLFVRDRLDMRASLEAGRAWQRLHLAATVAGLAAQPMNQPVERADREKASGLADAFNRELAKFAAEPGWEATFVFRLGAPERAARPSPRRPLEEVAFTQA